MVFICPEKNNYMKNHITMFLLPALVVGTNTSVNAQKIEEAGGSG